MLPRFVLESMGAILLVLVGLLLTLGNNSNIKNSITILGTFAFGAQKLLPSMQLIYARLSQMRSLSHSVTDVLSLFNQEINQKTYPLILKNKSITKPLRKNSIHFDNVSFSYKNSSEFVLKEFNFKLNFGEKIGIIGHTGSGKTTFVDLLMGLIPPKKGRILIDNKDINLVKK